MTQRIKTWQDRIAEMEDGAITTSYHVSSAMQDEIDTLRAELGDLPEAQAEMLAEIKRLRAQTWKLAIAELPEHDHFIHANDSETIECFRKDQLQAYGQQCAAHARRTALEEAAISCEAAMARIDACPKSGENEAVISCLSHQASVIRNLKEKK